MVTCDAKREERGLRTFANSVAPNQIAQSYIRVAMSADRSVRLFEKKAASVALRSCCADALTDPDLNCPHTSENPFSRIASHVHDIPPK